MHSPEQLQQKQQRLEWIWPLNHRQIIGTSASPCKRTSYTNLILPLTNISGSMLPSWKHALLISYCAVQTETVVAPISSPNQHERSFSKTTTAKLTGSSRFPSSSTPGLKMTERKGGPRRSRLPQKQQRWVHRASQSCKPHGHPCSQSSLPYSSPHRQAPTSATPELPFPLAHMELFKAFLKRGIGKELN